MYRTYGRKSSVRNYTSLHDQLHATLYETNGRKSSMQKNNSLQLACNVLPDVRYNAACALQVRSDDVIEGKTRIEIHCCSPFLIKNGFKLLNLHFVTVLARFGYLSLYVARNLRYSL